MLHQLLLTMDNDKLSNNLISFKLSDTGEIIASSKEKIALKGSGDEITFRSQSSIYCANDYIFAINAGSNSLAILKRNGDSIAHIKGSPFKTSSYPVSVTASEKHVFVACRGERPKKSSIRNFFRKIKMKIDVFKFTDESLHLQQNVSVKALYPYPGNINVTPNGKNLIMSWRNFDTIGNSGHNNNLLLSIIRFSHVSLWNISTDGLLTNRKDTFLGYGGSFGFSVHRDSKTFYQSITIKSGIRVLNINKNNVIKKGCFFKSGGVGCCWTALTNNNNFLYTTNFSGKHNDTITVFQVLKNQKLQRIQNLAPQNTILNTGDCVLSSNNKNLYVLLLNREETNFHIGTFSVEEGNKLKEVNSLISVDGTTLSGLQVL